MRIIIDTNRYRDFCENHIETVELFRQTEIIYIPFITLAELRAGFACGKRSKENEKILNQFLSRTRIRILFPDEETAHFYALLFKQLREQGTPIPTNDLWIASLAYQHNIPLYTRDKHFRNLPQLNVI